MERDFRTVVDDMTYRALFGKDRATLRIQFGLPPPIDEDDDRERDHMSILALETIAQIESEMTFAIITASTELNRRITLSEMRPVFKGIIDDWSKLAHKIADDEGLSFYRSQAADDSPPAD